VGLVNKPPEPGAFSRALRLGKLGFSLTGSYLSYQAQNLLLGQDDRRQRRFRQSSSRRMREELGSLKGAVMKLGQILSLQTQTLPDEVIQELASLQMQAPGMHPTLARAQFKAALGKYPEEIFREFEEEPFAAASLGQVHRALTRQGEMVAVKIQYPAIRAAIENDLKLLRSAALPARASGHLPGAVLDEVQRGFLEETDYVQEGKNLDYFCDGLAELGWVTVPKAYWDLTTARVLTMSFVGGEVAGVFLERKPPAAIRNLLGERLVELYYHQVHRLRRLHADHHPGNYLFRPDGRISVVDFGCVKQINFDITALIRACIARSWRRGNKEAREVLALMFGPQIPHARARKMLPILERMVSLLYPEKNSEVDFGKGDVLKVLGEAMKRAVQDKSSNPEFAFITRADLGLYSLLNRLGARVNVRAVWEKVDVSKGR
jgi:predicted unusual protein kinase regulating ubiquinone biosynthesis (AarF/ABC1/UbiB family)